MLLLERRFALPVVEAASAEGMAPLRAPELEVALHHLPLLEF